MKNDNESKAGVQQLCRSHMVNSSSCTADEENNIQTFNQSLTKREVDRRVYFFFYIDFLVEGTNTKLKIMQYIDLTTLYTQSR